MAHFDDAPKQEEVAQRIFRFFELLAKEKDDDAFAMVKIRSATLEEEESDFFAIVDGIRLGMEIDEEGWRARITSPEHLPDRGNLQFLDEENDPCQSGDAILVGVGLDGAPSDVTAKFRVRKGPDGWHLFLEDAKVM